MLNENLLALRKRRGLSQEELAARLNVVRQTVSKWEKGLSVPDAELLMRIAETFEVSVSELLGAKLAYEAETNAVAEQLSRINEQLAVKNRRARRVWRAVGFALLAIAALIILLVILNMPVSSDMRYGEAAGSPAYAERLIPGQ